MKRTTTVMVAVPAAAVLVATGVGVASAFDQPRPATTQPMSSTVHDPTPATLSVTRTPSGSVSVRHTTTPRQATTARHSQTGRATQVTPRATSTTRATTTQHARSYTYRDDCDRDWHGSGDHEGMHDGMYGGMSPGSGWHR